jgi:hypothetical protein
MFTGLVVVLVGIPTIFDTTISCMYPIVGRSFIFFSTATACSNLDILNVNEDIGSALNGNKNRHSLIMFKIVVFTSISQSCGGFCWNAVEYQHGVRRVVEAGYK